MLGRRNNALSFRQRGKENQENAHAIFGKTAGTKATTLGKPALGGNAGVQTRAARSALVDRSNTCYADNVQTQQVGKAPPIKKELTTDASKRLPVAHAAANKTRRTVRATTTTSSRPKPELKRPEEQPAVVDENVSLMDVETEEKSDAMEVDENKMQTPGRLIPDQEKLRTCDKRYYGRLDLRNQIRNRTAVTYGGGISEPGVPCDERITNPDLLESVNVQMVPQYVYAIFDYLQDLEIERMPLRADFLEECSDITSRMRYVLVDWMVQIHSRFELLPETLYVGIGLMDRYLSTRIGSLITKDELQMLGVTAMMVAAKFEECYPPDISDFTYVTGNAYSNDQLRRFEWKLLSETGFFCTLPPPITFLRRFSRLMQATADLHTAAKYFLELTTTEYSICYIPGCLRAAACLCLSTILLGEHDFHRVDGDGSDEYLMSLISKVWIPNLQFSAGYVAEDILPVIKKIAPVIERQMSPSKYRAIHDKYCKPENLSIALRRELQSHLLAMFVSDDEQEDGEV